MLPIGVVYGTKSGIIRRVIIPDGPGQLQNPTLLAPGESMYVFPSTANNTLEAAKVAIQEAIGKPALSPDCAVVDQSNNVVSIVKADPEIDVIADHALIPAYSPLIVSGSKYDPKTEEFTAPDSIILAGTVLKGGEITTVDQIIPGEVVKKS